MLIALSRTAPAGSSQSRIEGATDTVIGVVKSGAVEGILRIASISSEPNKSGTSGLDLLGIELRSARRRPSRNELWRSVRRVAAYRPYHTGRVVIGGDGIGCEIDYPLLAYSPSEKPIVIITILD